MPVNISAKANEFLAFLVEESSPVWRVAVTQAYEGGTDAARAIENARKKLTRLNLSEDEVAGCSKGPGTLATEYFTTVIEQAEDYDPNAPKLLPSQISAVVEFLKNEGKILQLGAGRGKVTLILDSGAANTDADKIAADDLDGLLGALTALIAGQKEDIDVLQVQNTELIESRKRIEAEIVELRNENNLYSNSTWS